ncbi:uncharacterized protein LOC120538250 [Polypterus senegalus]|uniref:uncharacterized protein LOC120538250 n=1 Tax=Polypterus senegalus TaxID=55291 RepID=UPI001965A015|nr:uncharacterized protein LOC120538250 [Polypterus senegalus]
MGQEAAAQEGNPLLQDRHRKDSKRLQVIARKKSGPFRGVFYGQMKQKLNYLDIIIIVIRQPNLCNEIRATIVDHVINHGLTLREAGLRVQPNLSRNTVASIVRTFRQEHRIERREHQGGRRPIFTQEQEREIINLVLANNAIRLREIQAHIVNDHQIFNNVLQVSLSTIGRILKKHQVVMKQLYKVPFERNSNRVKVLRHEYVARVLRMDAEEVPHEFIYIDEAGFNLTTVRRREETSLATGLLSMYQGNVGVTLPFVLPLHRMGSFTAMPTWVLTTLTSFLHF